MTTDFIEERSHKVFATVAIIEALEFGDDDLAELTKYLAKRCGFAHIANEINIHDLETLNEFYDFGEPESQVLYILEPSNDFANLLGDRIETETGVLAQRDGEPLGGDGYDRYIENLITDQQDSQEPQDDYIDDFA